MTDSDDTIFFLDETIDVPDQSTQEYWKILVVDDEKEVHEVTSMALKSFIFEGKRLDIISAFSTKETIQVLREYDDIVLILLDIVMEEEDSGLQIVKYIREELNNKFVRIVLRTGQPGYAPEKDIILNYDINDYKEKNELTSNKLFTTIVAAIRSYKDLALIHQTSIEKEHFNKELQIARDIQFSSMPMEFPLFPERNDLDIYATMTPAYEVGGDFYDIFLVEKNKLCVFVGDVSGKGIGASLFMMTCRTLIRSEALRQQNPLKVLSRVNSFLCSSNNTGLFSTLFFAYVHTDTGVMEFSNAGHNPPLIISANGEVRDLEMPDGVPLSFFDNEPYLKKQVTLQPEDYLFVFTDGVTDANDRDEKMFSSEMLISKVENKSYKEAKSLIDHVTKEIHIHVGEAEQTDDMTMLALKIINFDKT